jgi:hypothetical protein
MTNERKIEELNKLNKAQRNTLRKAWMGRKINNIFVFTLMDNVARVKVCNENNFWMVAEVGPKGGLKHKEFVQL